MKLASIKQSSKPEIGDYRIEYKFAWWPKRVQNKIIWLEKYKRVFEYRRRNRLVNLHYAVIELKDYPAWDLIAEQLI